MKTLTPILLALLVTICFLFLLDRTIDVALPHFIRLRYNFSATYLDREVKKSRLHRPIVFLGDSVLWGFGISESETALAVLRAHNNKIENLSYVGGSPVNTLAMVRLLLARGIRPQAVVFNVNQKEFNSADSAYQKLYPAVEQLAWPNLTERDRNRVVSVLPQSQDSRIDRILSRAWHFYGMRADIRDLLFHESDAAHGLESAVEWTSGAATDIQLAHRPSPEKFVGTYDLSPLASDNVALQALVEIAQTLQGAGIPAIAVLTPTNHRLLHDYIDSSQYRHNLAFVEATLERSGTRVVNLDSQIPADDFIDNDHLTARGNRLFASMLERFVKP